MTHLLALKHQHDVEMWVLHRVRGEGGSLRNVSPEFVHETSAMLSGSLVTTAWSMIRFRPPDIKDSWKYRVYRGQQTRGDLSPWKFDMELTTHCERGQHEICGLF
jgi:hypothetical protein